jgi:O-antigen/teichoic acid export membrane protein
MADTTVMEPRAVAAEPEVAERLAASNPLGRRAAHGVAWVAGARLGAQVVQFAASVVLARLLLPSAYGLVAIVWTVTSFAFLLSDLGLGASLVQSERVSERDAATAFYINALSGLFLTGLVIALRGPLAELMGQPRVAGLLAVASIGFTIAVTTVPTALLERQMRFGTVAAIDIGSSTVGFCVSIGMAAAGAGAISLVIGPLIATALASVVSFVAAGWLPKAGYSRASARQLFAFGSHLTGFNLINYWARNSDNLLLGRFAGTTALGLYNRAYMLMGMPINQVTGVLGRVLLPIFSALSEDMGRLRAAVLRVCRTSCVLVFPLLFGLAAVAHNFITAAFGSAWAGAAPLLTILALSGVPQVVTATSGLVCQAVGQTQVLSTWGNLNSLSVIAAIVIGLPWKAEGVAIAFTVRAYLLLPLSLVPLKRAVGLGTADIARASAMPFVAAGLMGLWVAAVGLGLSGVMPVGVVLLVQLLVGAMVYLRTVAVMDRSALLQVRRLLQRRPAV